MKKQEELLVLSSDEEGEVPQAVSKKGGLVFALDSNGKGLASATTLSSAEKKDVEEKEKKGKKAARVAQPWRERRGSVTLSFRTSRHRSLPATTSLSSRRMVAASRTTLGTPRATLLRFS